MDEHNRPRSAFDVALKALLTRSEEGEPEKVALTYRTLKLIDEAINEGRPDSLMLQGIIRYHFPGEAYQHFKAAKDQGSIHPLMYYYLGRCYWQGNRGVEENFESACDCFSKLIKGWLDNGSPCITILSSLLCSPILSTQPYPVGLAN